MTNSATVSRWSEMEIDKPMPQITRRRIIGEKGMISHVTLEAGCVVPMHSHLNEQFSCILSGRLRFTIEVEGRTEDMTVGEGETMHLPPHVPHAAEALEETVVLDVFVPPSEGTGIDRK